MIRRLCHEPGLSVKVFADVTSAMRYIKRKDVYVNILILDGRLSCGSDFPKAGTQNEMVTGIVLYKQIRETNPRLPIILYTTTQEVYRNFAQGDPHLTKLMAHAATLDSEVVDTLERIFPGNFRRRVPLYKKAKSI